MPFVVVGSVVVFALFGLYRHWMRYASQRDYLQIAQAAVVATLALLGYVAVVQPRLVLRGGVFVSRADPGRVLVLYGLLMLVFVGRRASSCSSSTSARSAATARGATRARS